MKVGMNLLLWTGAATEEHFSLLKDINDWGFDGVEFPMFDTEATPWAECSKVLDELGLGRTVVGVLPEGANLIGEDTGERSSAVAFLKECVDACSALGADTLAGPVCSPVGHLVGRGPNQQEKDWAAEGLKVVGEHAQSKNIAISIEPLNRFETYFINTQESTGELVDNIALPGVGQLYDSFHANIEEKDTAEAIRCGGKRINHVHISANDRATPGEDHVEWEVTFKTLKEIGYDGWLTIESFGEWIPELAAATCIWRKMAPSEEHVAREGLRFIREMWAK